MKKLTVSRNLKATSKTFLVIAVVLTLAGFASQEVQATPMPIVGLLNISGSGPAPGAAAPGAASVSGRLLDVVLVARTSGSFSNIQRGTPVAIASPAIFLGFSTVEASLWSVDGFTFVLNPGSVISDSQQITMSGTGTILTAGASPTYGARWKYTSDGGGTFTFQLTAGSLVPDSGATIMLLGVGLIGLAGCRARFATS